MEVIKQILLQPTAGKIVKKRKKSVDYSSPSSKDLLMSFENLLNGESAEFEDQ